MAKNFTHLVRETVTTTTTMQKETRMNNRLIAALAAVLLFLAIAAIDTFGATRQFQMDACTGSTVSGTIVDDVTGAPMSGVSVRSYNKTTGVLWDSASTDANGNYSLGLNECDYVRVTTKAVKSVMQAGYFADYVYGTPNYYDTQLTGFGHYTLNWRYFLY
jgi:hypothetical protein